MYGLNYFTQLITDENESHFLRVDLNDASKCHLCLKHKCDQAFLILDRLIKNGYNVTDILDVIIKVLIHNKELTDAQRVFMIEETIKIICLNEESSSLVHLYRLVVTLGRTKSQKN